MRLYVVIYVNDLLIGGNDPKAIKKFKGYLSQCFHMKDLGLLKYFLGIEVSRSPKGFYLSQRKYALDIVKECGLLGRKPVSTPMEQNHKLATDEGQFFHDSERYRWLVGHLVYLTYTCPELSYAVHMLAQFMQKPRTKHWEAAIRVVKYLKGSYCDSDWATCPMTRRSLKGFIVMLGNAPLAWKTKKHDTVSCSSTEAEYRAMGFTVRELKWNHELLSCFGVPHTQPMRLHCDSKSALLIASNLVFHEMTKHLETDCHFVQDEFLDGSLATAHIRTIVKLADIFTKALGSKQFSYLRCKLGIRDLHAPT
ncbi:uncharacterized protein LOC112087523 [Eutrema salsugineum]|uniref:uncharacterized protein LOC112087523 n=1 Tax=Eutrema salsugineum TaxID=72664 RepID=UPI000CED3B06|nr:uncharacterized protein LOC112087523 [Eutrema salsugineum]